MGLFGSVKQAKVNGGGVYFLPGLYKVKIDKVRVQRSAKNGKDYWIVETTILESNNPDRAVGSHCSQVVEIGHMMGPVHIKAFVCAVSGVDAQDEDANDRVEAKWAEMTDQTLDFEQICEMIADESTNPLEGLEMNLECSNVKTRAKTDFTKHFWEPVAEAD